MITKHQSHYLKFKKNVERKKNLKKKTYSKLYPLMQHQQKYTDLC